jgi:hypothetical protein
VLWAWGRRVPEQGFEPGTEVFDLIRDAPDVDVDLYRRALTRVHCRGDFGLSRGLGRGARGSEVLVAVVVGIALANALWWAYLDLVMLAAERRLSEAMGGERARDSRAR